jgi:hypothetical protein
MTPSLIFVAVVVLLWAAVVVFGISCEKRQKKEDERVRQMTGGRLLQEQMRREQKAAAAREEPSSAGHKNPADMTTAEHKAWFAGIVEKARREHPLPPEFERRAQRLADSLLDGPHNPYLDPPEPPGNGFC